MRRRKSVALLVVLTVGATLGLTACSQAKARASQCAYIISNGYLDARHIQHIIHPGEKASTNNAYPKYVYCNARNYLVRPDGDLTSPLTGRTEPNSDGTPGNPVKVSLSMYWQLNQNDSVLRSFLPFCEKYNCFGGSDTSGSDRFSSPGWNGMLKETFAPALERATVKALLSYHGNLPTDQSQWPKLGDEISQNFMSQVKVADGSDANDFFCSSGSLYTDPANLHTGYQCKPVQIQIDTVEYANPQAEALFQQSTTLDAQKQLADKQRVVNEAELRAAKAKYGNLASYYLGLLDTIKECHDSGQSCTIVLGNGAGVNVTQK